MDKKANGVGKTPPGRLSSFKKERDLSLGGAKPPQTAAAAKQASEAKKKTFKPNLNVQRTVKKEPSASDKNKDGSAGGRRQRDGAAGGRGRGRGGGAGGDRRSGHGRGQPAVIQLDSVFDKGMGADPTTRRRPGGSSRGGDDGAPTRPLFDSSSLKVDKEEEEKRLKVILQDNFIADLDSDEKDKRFLPVQLPMINTGKVFKDEDEEPADDADGGVKNFTFSLTSGYDITKNWVIGVTAIYRRLTGDAGDSPIVESRGSKDQFTAGVGLSYQF